jgi:hypothetical protein
MQVHRLIAEGTPAFAALAARTGLGERDLARRAVAWRLGGSAGLEAGRRVGSGRGRSGRRAAADRDAGRPARQDQRGAAHYRGQPVTAARMQLRLGRDLRWYPYARSDDDREPSGAAEADPARGLKGL